MKRIYIAAPLHRAAEARELAASLRAEGHDVVSRWHAQDVESVSETALSRLDRQIIAKTNYQDLYNATHLILLADPKCRGSLVEAGAALVAGATLVIVGHWHDHTLMLDAPHAVTWVPTAADAVQALRSEAA